MNHKNKMGRFCCQISKHYKTIIIMRQKGQHREREKEDQRSRKENPEADHHTKES